MHTFRHILSFVTTLLLEDDAPDSKTFKLDVGQYADVSLTAEWDIMVNFFEDEDLEEQDDGG